MDLHVIGPLASPAERAAVDAVLGPPATRWVGGDRTPGTEGHVSHGGHAARSRRDLLLPVLHAVQDRIGWISQPALNYVCKRLTIPPAEAYGVATFYALFATKPRPPVVAHLCDDIACRLAGAETVIGDVERALGAEGTPAGDGQRDLVPVALSRALRDRAPAAMVTSPAEQVTQWQPAPVDAAGMLGRLDGGAVDPERPLRGTRLVPQAGEPGPPTAAPGGQSSIRRPSTTIDAPAASAPSSALARRAGAGDRRGDEVRGCSGAAARPSRPGASGRPSQPRSRRSPTTWCATRTSRSPARSRTGCSWRSDPFAVVEAMAIEAFAVGAAQGLPLHSRRVPAGRTHGSRTRSRAATEAGLLDGLDIEVRRGAGAYICGEETALFESIEGKRGEPRNKPPFPVEVGLFDKPTAVNNVETIDQHAADRRRGRRAEAFKAIGTEGSTGPKLFCLSGNVERPGTYEVPFGTTLGELLALGGGVPGGRSIKAILLGGAAGVFVGPDALDLPLTFEATRAAGATLGSGVVMVFDERADLVGTLTRIAQFFRDESCGQCVPCRVGTVRQEELLARLAAGSGVRSREEELVLLREVGQAMRDASICGLGQTASSAIESAFRQPGLVAL